MNWYTLANGKSKLFQNEKDARSWAIQQKSEIVKTIPLTFTVPSDFKGFGITLKEAIEFYKSTSK